MIPILTTRTGVRARVALLGLLEAGVLGFELVSFGRVWSFLRLGRVRLGRLFFGLPIPCSSLGVSLTIRRVLYKPALDVRCRGWVFRGQNHKLFELFAAPTAPGSGPTTVCQLAGYFDLVYSDEIEHLSAGDMEAQAEFIVGLHWVKGPFYFPRYYPGNGSE